MPLPVIGAAPGVAPGVQAFLNATGTAYDNISDTDIVTGGKTIILTLTGTSWVAAGSAFDAQRQAIIDKLDSDAAEANGWDAERSNIAVTDVVRTNDTVVTITLPALGSYNITAPENVASGAPSAALATSSGDLASPQTFSIASEPTSAALTGTVTGAGGESINTVDIRDGGKTLILTLTGLNWVASGVAFDNERQAILDGLASNRAWFAGWTNEVIPNTALTAVVRTSNTVVTITLAAHTAYITTYDTGVSMNETITATIPASAMVGSASIVASPTFKINYKFFDGFESYTTTDEIDSNPPDNWQTFQNNDPANNTVELSTAVVRTGTQSLHCLKTVADNSKAALIKGENAVVEQMGFILGDIVTCIQYLYIPDGATNPWGSASPTTKAPRFYDLEGSQIGAKSGGIRMGWTTTNSTKARLDRKKLDEIFPEITNITVDNVTVWPRDEWFKLEFRAKLGEHPTDHTAFDTFAFGDPGWFQWIVDFNDGNGDTIILERSCTTMPNDEEYDRVTIGLTISLDLCECYIDDVTIALVDTAVT